MSTTERRACNPAKRFATTAEANNWIETGVQQTLGTPSELFTETNDLRVLRLRHDTTDQQGNPSSVELQVHFVFNPASQRWVIRGPINHLPQVVATINNRRPRTVTASQARRIITLPGSQLNELLRHR